MADFDVDALVAELDEILDQPATVAKPAPTRSTATTGAVNKRGSSSNAPLPSASTSTSTFDLTDSDDDEATTSRRSRTASAVATARSRAASNSNSGGGGRSTNAGSTAMHSSRLASSATSNVTAASSTRAPKPAAPSSSSFDDDSDEEFQTLLADMDSAIAKPAVSSSANRASTTTTQRRPSPPAASTLIHAIPDEAAAPSRAFGAGASAGAKCYPTLLTSTGGDGACPALLCCACDQRVLTIRHARWRDTEEVEYMFFRNFYPDLARLGSALIRDHAAASASSTSNCAYACACSWQSVGPEGCGKDTLDLTRLARASSGTQGAKHDGCSSWAELKWVCTGH